MIFIVNFMAPTLRAICRWLMSALSRFVTAIDELMRETRIRVTKRQGYAIKSLHFVILATKPEDNHHLSLLA
jgi:hypothetical protein